MAQDKRIGSKAPVWANRDRANGIRFDSATYIGLVKSNVDPSRSGRLKVWIPDFGGNEDDEMSWRTVSYASPFFGATYQPENTLNNTFTTVNHTYGMWAVPPDVNNQVLCTFVGGDPDRGYWFACVNPTISHYMVPGLAAGNAVDTDNVSPDIKASILPSSNVPPQSLPVVEFNEHTSSFIDSGFYTNKKPIHDYQANILFQQGLDRDSVRGAISSSSQRETPSHVFGISTPGRAYGNDTADDPDFQRKLQAGAITPETYAVKSRKGGHQFVMDDGDVNGKDQLIRLRTAGGHQLLMNDTDNVIYIANTNGSSWMEFSENGHINFYSAGGYNIRTEGDLNFHSDQNINMFAGSSLRLYATSTVDVNGASLNLSASDSTNLFGGKTTIGASGTLAVGAGGRLTVGSSSELVLNGSTIDLNTGGNAPSVGGKFVQQAKFSDVSYDNTTRLWSEVVNATNSITSVLPTHEPWARGGTPANITKTITTTECPPIGAAPSSYTLPPPNGNKLDFGKVRGQPAPWTTDTAFLNKVKQISSSLSLNYIDMLACMNLETGGTFDPAITNSLGYTGLIQFGKAAASAMGTTTSFLRSLNRVDQCDWVLKYFVMNRLNQKAPNPRLVDIYLTILWPVGVGKPDSYVIFPAGSKAYAQNPAFDPGRKVGYVTVGMVANTIAVHLTRVKQALANAGVSGNITATPSTTTTNSQKTDVGLTNSAGKQIVGNTCPAAVFNSNDTYSPSNGVGEPDCAAKLTQQQMKATMAELGYFESGYNYSMVSSDGTRIGKYQVDAQLLAAIGYIKPDAIKQYGNATLSKNESWTNKDQIGSQAAFLSNKAVQDQIQYDEFISNYQALLTNGGIKCTDSVCIAAGMLLVAHQFRSVDIAKKWRNDGAAVDAYKRGGDVYFNHGRYAIDVLSTGNAK